MIKSRLRDDLDRNLFACFVVPSKLHFAAAAGPEDALQDVRADQLHVHWRVKSGRCLNRVNRCTSNLNAAKVAGLSVKITAFPE
jgi:hypothetical protein